MNTYTYIIVGVVALAAVGVFLLRRSSNSFPASGPALQKAMAKRAQRAVSQARRFNVVLDFSPKSIERVERLFTAMHQLRAMGKMSEPRLDETSLDYGSYIGEVIRRSATGEWSRDHPQFGEKCFPLTTKGTQVFPVNWCVKRIENGPDDDLWFKFQSLAAIDPSR